MSFAQLQIGTEIASPLHKVAASDAVIPPPVKTTGDLLAIYAGRSGRTPKMLKTVCGHLGRYLDRPGDDIPLDLIETRKRGFRPYLEDRRYAENSIRTYVNQQRNLLNVAKKHGWDPVGNPAPAWLPLLEVARREHLIDIVRHFANATKTPKEVTKEAVDCWGEARIRDGIMFTTVAGKKNQFWRLLEKTGWLSATPVHMLKFTPYSTSLKTMPAKLREDILAVLQWKQATVARNRPKYGRIRAVTANNIRVILQQLTSYVVKIYGDDPQNLGELIQENYIAGFIEWMVNERHIKGRSLQGRLASVLAIVKYHPMFAGRNFNWFKSLIDDIPVEDLSERKKRKGSKYLSYEELEAIPEKIRAFRDAYEKKRNKNPVRVAQLATEELMFRWYLVFPWRQRNLRECRISGTYPNLFKARIPAITEIDKPLWIQKQEDNDPSAEFWQISFAPDGTKTHIPVDLFLPRSLVQPLEEYLEVYRPLLVNGNDPGTLFLTPRGKPMRAEHVGKVIGHWSTLYATRRTTPHVIRDSVAYRWLKEHPKDYLTLSKILWHKNVQTTIQIYGAKFNESSGTCAMEAWLDQRAANN